MWQAEDDAGAAATRLSGRRWSIATGTALGAICFLSASLGLRELGQADHLALVLSLSAMWGVATGALLTWMNGSIVR